MRPSLLLAPNDKLLLILSPEGEDYSFPLIIK